MDPMDVNTILGALVVKAVAEVLTLAVAYGKFSAKIDGLFEGKNNHEERLQYLERRNQHGD